MKRRIKRSKKKKIKSVINLCMGTIVGINMSPIYTLAVGDIYNFNNVVIVASNDMLDEINMEKVSFNDVRLTLANNQKIDEEYKKYISEYIDRLEERLPEIDLRIFI